jgi:integrase/recombinase XerC
MTQEKSYLEALLEDFQSHLEARGRSIHTLRAYLTDIRQFAAWFTDHTGEPFTMANVTEHDVQDWQDVLVADRKPATVNRKMASLSQLYHWAGAERHVERDPTRYIEWIREESTAPKAFKKREVNRILRQARKSGNKRDAALLELLAATGLRASEVAGLKIEDLELNDRSGWVTVRAAKGKGKKRRRVPVYARARRLLAEYLEEREQGAQGGEEQSRSSLSPGEPAFLSRKGGAITPYAVWYTVKKYADLADVKDATPHRFRHSVATRLVRDPDVDLVTAATYLGHSRLDTTMQYSRPSEEDLEAAADRLGRSSYD